MTGQQLQTLGAWALVAAALIWIASDSLRNALARRRAQQAAALAQQDADWETHVESVRDMLDGDPTDDCRTLDEFCGGVA